MMVRGSESGALSGLLAFGTDQAEEPSGPGLGAVRVPVVVPPVCVLTRAEGLLPGSGSFGMGVEGVKGEGLEDIAGGGPARLVSTSGPCWFTAGVVEWASSER